MGHSRKQENIRRDKNGGGTIFFTENGTFIFDQPGLSILALNTSILYIRDATVHPHDSFDIDKIIGSWHN